MAGAPLDAAGAHVWSKRFGDATVTSATKPKGVAVDASGDLAIAGDLDGTIDSGGGPLTTKGDLDVFVARLDATGNHLWSRSHGDAQKQVAGAPGGNLVLVGSFAGDLDFGAGPLSSAGGADIFVAKLHTP